jgi:hypothetical protein
LFIDSRFIGVTAVQFDQFDSFDLKRGVCVGGLLKERSGEETCSARCEKCCGGAEKKMAASWAGVPMRFFGSLNEGMK